MKQIQYFRPRSVEEASEFLCKYGPEAKLLAGGTDLLIQMRSKPLAPKYLVDIGFISSLKGISLDKNNICIGAATKIAELEKSEIIRTYLPGLAQAAHVLASLQVRNLATLGGNLCNAAPSADMAPPLIALQAKALIYSSIGYKTVELENFFKGPSQTVLSHEEILVCLIVPIPPKNTGVIYLKHTLKKSMDIALVGVAVMINSENGICLNSRIVLGAVAPTPMRAKGAEGFINQSKLGREEILKAAQSASLECKPISDVRCGSDYRRKMVKVLTARALELLKAQGVEK